jgi:hypothetical protein
LCEHFQVKPNTDLFTARHIIVNFNVKLKEIEEKIERTFKVIVGKKRSKVKVAAMRDTPYITVT